MVFCKYILRLTIFLASLDQTISCIYNLFVYYCQANMISIASANTVLCYATVTKVDYSFCCCIISYSYNVVDDGAPQSA